MQCPAARPPSTSLFTARNHRHQVNTLDDTPLPNFDIRDIVLTEQNKQLLAELRGASALALPRCTVSRHATAWAESLEGAISGHQSCADIVAAYCWLRCQKVLTEMQN